MPARGARGETRLPASGRRADISSADGGPAGEDDVGGELDRAHRLLRRAARCLDRTAAEEGWAVPFSPVRFLVLGHLRGASAFGFRPRRLARLLEMKPSSLAHHLDVLEDVELIVRRRQGAYDGRRVAVRLTERGLFAFWRLRSALRAASLSGAP